MTTRRHTILGDSTTQGTADGLTALSQGGTGSWQDIVRELLLLTPGIGPLVSTGLHQTCRGVYPYGGTEWERAGATWSLASAFAQWDVAPFNLAWCGDNGTGHTFTYTHPRGLPSMVGFYIDWIDRYDLGEGEWSYRINGGSWTNHGQTLTIPSSDNYRRFYVSADIDVGGTIQFRQANAAGTAKGLMIVGIHPFYLPPNSDGLIFQMIAAGGQTLYNAVLQNQGDRLAFLDSVVCESGSFSEVPDSLSFMFGNDMTLYNHPPQYTTNMATLHTRCVNNSILFGAMDLWEMDESLRGYSDQAAYRTAIAANCSGYSPSCPELNIFAELTNSGYGGQGVQYTRLSQAGLIWDTIHQHKAFNPWLANIIYKWLMQEFFSDITEPPEGYSPALCNSASVPATYRAKGPSITLAKSSKALLLK